MSNSAYRLRESLKHTNRFKSILFVVPVLLLVFIGWFVYSGLVKPGQQSELVDQPLNDKGLDLTSTVALAKDGDVNKNKKIDMGDTVQVKVKLDNSSLQRSRYITIKSGLSASSLINVHDILGATGVVTKDGEVALPNIVMQPGQTQEVGFSAIVISGAADREIEIKPSLIDTTGKTVAFGKTTKYIVFGSDTKLNNGISATAERGE